MKTKTIERLVDGGFEAPIQRKMNADEYQALLERALDGEKYAQDAYLTKFRMVVGEVSEDLLLDLRICMHLEGMQEGIESFLERLSMRVDVFVEEVEDLLRQHVYAGFPPMKEPGEIELEDPVLEQNPQAQDLVFRVWAPEGGEPGVEFTCMDPEDRDDYVLTDVEALVAASQMDDLRRIVEDTLHDLQKKQEGGGIIWGW